MGKTKTLRDHASDLAESLAPHVENARDKAAPMLADARDKAGPLLADARDKAAPYVAEARDRIASDVLPVVSSALGSLDEATEDVRHETLRRGKAVTAALKGEIAAPEPKRRKRRGPLLLVLLGLGAIGFAVARRLGDRQATSTWQSSYTPPAPAPAPAPASPSTAPASPAAAASPAPGTADTAASDPAEAAADATEAPHTATTPDEPATEIDVDKPPS
jgi:hypothetical protein